MHSLGLFLFAQFYLRQSHRPDTADHWPVEGGMLHQMEPSSPMRMSARPFNHHTSAGGAVALCTPCVSCADVPP